MSWNYRVLAYEVDSQIYFKVHEVYYDKYDKPNGYTKEPITIEGEDLEDIMWSLKEIEIAFSKPILWEGDKFPSEYK